MAGLALGKKALVGLGAALGAGGGLAFALDEAVRADLTLHPPKMTWSHTGHLDSLDHASIRRGFQVYKQVRERVLSIGGCSSRGPSLQVCAACHRLKYLAYRHLINVSHTEAEMKAEAEENMVSGDSPFMIEQRTSYG